MQHLFFESFFQNTRFPAEARKTLTDALNSLHEEITPILCHFETDYHYESTQPLVDSLAESSKISAHTIWMLIFILAAEKARSLYTSDKIFWDTFSDLRYKAQECFDLHGVWGTFVPHWYPRFYKGNIVKLGRMEYETRQGALTQFYNLFGITLGPDSTTIHLHIPSSGEPFDKASRLDSYRQAYNYFCKNGQPLICICGSWLLYSEYASIFPGNSNIGSFRKEFIMMKEKQTEAFGDAWRVFGKNHKNSADQLPESTSLQRNFKTHILNGGHFGTGTGVLIFDGEKILSESEVEQK